MNVVMIYLKKAGCQPLAPVIPIGLRDVQQDMPACWCLRCGREVYQPDWVLCSACRKEAHHELLSH